MTNGPSQVQPQSGTEIGLDILMILFLLLFPHWVPLPFYSYSLVCFLLLLAYLKRRRQTLKNIGLYRDGNVVPVLLTGAGAGLLWAAWMQWGYIPGIRYLFSDKVEEYKEYDFIRHKPLLLLGTICFSWIIGGFYEEIIFRGYVQRTIEQWFRGRSRAYWCSACITSVLFGLYHIQQGIFGVIPAILGGLYYSWILYRNKGNLWYSIIAHATYDSIALILIYFGVFGKW